MGGDEDGHAVAAGEVGEVVPEAVAGGGVDAGGGFVEDQHLGAMEAGGGELQALAQAERERGGGGSRVVLEAEAGEALGEPRRDLRFGHAIEAGVEAQVLDDRQFLPQREALGHVADAGADRDVVGVDRAAEEGRGALAGGEQAGQHLHGRRLAAAVRAEEAEDLAARDLEGDAVDRDEVAEAAGEALGRDGDLGRERGARRHAEGFGARGARPGLEDREGVLEIRRAGHRDEGGGSVVGDDAAVVDGDDALEAGRLVHVGGGDDHRHAGAIGADGLDQIPELAARQGVDAGGRLVEHQEIGVVDEGAAERQFLLHTAGELTGGAIGEGIEAGGGEQALDAGAPLGRLEAEETGVEVDVLGDRQGRVEVSAQPLRHVGDAVGVGVAGAAINLREAEDIDLARLEAADTGDQAEERRLADAVRADEGGRGAARQRQGDTRQSDGPAIAMVDGGDADGDASVCGGGVRSIRARGGLGHDLTSAGRAGAPRGGPARRRRARS